MRWIVYLLQVSTSYTHIIKVCVWWWWWGLEVGLKGFVLYSVGL